MPSDRSTSFTFCFFYCYLVRRFYLRICWKNLKSISRIQYPRWFYQDRLNTTGHMQANRAHGFRADSVALAEMDRSTYSFRSSMSSTRGCFCYTIGRRLSAPHGMWVKPVSRPHAMTSGNTTIQCAFADDSWESGNNVKVGLRKGKGMGGGEEREKGVTNASNKYEWEKTEWKLFIGKKLRHGTSDEGFNGGSTFAMRFGVCGSAAGTCVNAKTA